MGNTSNKAFKKEKSHLQAAAKEAKEKGRRPSQGKKKPSRKK